MGKNLLYKIQFLRCSEAKASPRPSLTGDPVRSLATLWAPRSPRAHHGFEEEVHDQALLAERAGERDRTPLYFNAPRPLCLQGVALKEQGEGLDASCRWWVCGGRRMVGRGARRGSRRREGSALAFMEGYFKDSSYRFIPIPLLCATRACATRSLLGCSLLGPTLQQPCHATAPRPSPSHAHILYTAPPPRTHAHTPNPPPSR